MEERTGSRLAAADACREITATQQCISANFIECDLANGATVAMIAEVNTYLADTLALIGGRCTNPCRDEPCMNDGECRPTFDFEDFTCQCAPGFYGDTCQNRECSELIVYLRLLTS